MPWSSSRCSRRKLPAPLQQSLPLTFDLPQGPEEEVVEVDDGLDEDEPGQGKGEEANTDALSAKLAQELHAQLNNLRPRRR